MKKKIEKALKKSRLAGICIAVLLTACNNQSEVYLEPYLIADTGEVCDDETEGTITDIVIGQAGADIVKTTEVSQADAEIPDLLYVYICGAVLYPDVYALPEGSRICDGIAMAGGLREDADEMSVNQAQLVSDGQMIRIYTREEVASGAGTEAGNETFKEDMSVTGTEDKININTATKSELMTLPGIGSAKADAILHYRAKQGDFDSIEDLMQIPGIKEGILAQIRERIKID